MDKATVATRVLVLALLATAAGVSTFGSFAAVPALQQRGGRGGPGGPGGAPLAAQQSAPTDLTGYWVSVVNEDWRWRMVTPQKGDYTSVPLNAAGRQLADSWDPAADVRNGNECRPFGVGGIMHVPTRLNITWQDPNTLRIDTDAGKQTRLLNFGSTPSPGEPTLQGYSMATWEFAAGGRGQVRRGGLKVVTTGMQMGYLRWNGVPYSDKTVLTEYFDRTSDFGQELVTVTTIVEDPTYLNQSFITTSHFRKEPNGSKWDPTPCETAPPSVPASIPARREQ